MAKPKKKKSKVIFVIEILVLLLFIGGLYIYGQVSTRLDTIEQPVLDTSKIEVNEDVQKTSMEENSGMTGYTTYALFGIDHRDKNAALAGENSDTIIIANVNNDTKQVDLVSIYRDTLLNIGNDIYAKANAAYAYGGPEQAISMLNRSLDLNITDYATVDFNALTTVIDCVGGLDIPMSYAEIVHMNNYCKETSEETGKDYTPIEIPETPPEDQEAEYGTYHLNGVQATSYCRIRYTASMDMGRTERQRRVIHMIVEKAQHSGLTTIFKIMDEVFSMVQTSLSKTEILQLIPSMVGYDIHNTTGFPMDYKFSNIKGSIIVPTTLESNVIKLHEFLFPGVAYTPSEEVKNASENILKIVNGEGSLTDEAPVVTEETENTADDNFFWSESEGYMDVVDPGTGGGDDYGGGETTDPGTGGETTDPGTGGETTDPGTGGGDDYGGDIVDPGTGGGDDYGGDIVDPGTGGGDDYGGDIVDPGTGGGDDYGGDTGGGDYGGDYGGDDYGGGDIVLDNGGDGAEAASVEAEEAA